MHIWLAAILVSCLRSLPMWIVVNRPSIPDGVSWLPIGYIPKDWLQYVAFIHQSANTGNWMLSNPFTTEPQSGRFFLLFHQLLGAVHAATGISGFWLLELSRFPLTLLFFWVLWRFLVPILPELNHRSWACWMVAFSGGLDFLLQAVSGLLPESFRMVVLQDLWHMQGWSTFQAFYNPLWIAALTIMLCIIRPILQPNGPEMYKDRLIIGLGLVILWFTHPYSAIVVFVITAVYFFLQWCLGTGIDRRVLSLTVISLAPAVFVIVLITLWQLQDPVFEKSSGGVFGKQALPVFWYPLTLGGVGFFALRGWRKFLEINHPWRFGIAGWTLAVMFLHSSPILNGYHFVPYLHLPVCIAAAPAVADYFTAISHKRRQTCLISFIIILFSSFIATTVISIIDLDYFRIPTAYLKINNHLQEYPQGNVLAPPDLGNLIPALTPHRVFVGHWFLTPDYRKRVFQYQKLVENPKEYEAELKNLLIRAHINYLIVLKQFSKKIESVLVDDIKEKVDINQLTFFWLKKPLHRDAEPKIW